MNIINYRDFLADPRGAKAAEDLAACTCANMSCKKCSFDFWMEEGQKIRFLLQYIEDPNLHGLSTGRKTRTAKGKLLLLELNDNMRFQLDAILRIVGKAKYNNNHFDALQNIVIESGNDVQFTTELRDHDEAFRTTVINGKTIEIDFYFYSGITILVNKDDIRSKTSDFTISYEGVFLLDKSNFLKTKIIQYDDNYKTPLFMTVKADDVEQIFVFDISMRYSKSKVALEYFSCLTSQQLICDTATRQKVIRFANQIEAQEKLHPLLQPVYDHFKDVEKALEEPCKIAKEVVKHAVMPYL